MPDFQLMHLSSHNIQADLSLSTDVLLNLKYYAERYNMEAFEDHVNSINAMIELIHGQRQYPQLTADIWARNELDIMSTKEFGELFPERLVPLPIDEHNVAEKALNRSYGSSMRCIWNGHFVAVKKINRRLFHHHEANFRDALNVLESFNKPPLASPYIVNIVGVSWDKDLANMYLIYPLAPERSLFDAFSNPRILPEHRLQLKASDKVSILLDISKAVDHLHKCGIIHGRIKDANVMMFPDLRAKLSEVGVHPFLSNNTRLTLKGTHGLRWTAPEVMQQEVEWDTLAEEYRRKTVVEVPTLQTLAAITAPAVLSPSVDIYAIGVLAVVLLTETVPFYNIPWDEGVKNVLLEGSVPQMKARYPDQELLHCLEDDLIHPCLAPPYMRPSASEVIKYLENLYCNILHQENETGLQEHEKSLVQVQSELAQIQDKMKEHEILLAKGKELIRRKEDEKLRARELKVKREKDLEIEKARQKMLTFKAELEGLQEDKDGAEADMETLMEMIAEGKATVSKNFHAPLQNRDQGFIDLEQEVLLDIYCDDVEYDRLEPKLTNRSLIVVSPFIPWSSAVIGSSPFSSIYQAHVIPDFSSKELGMLAEQVNSRSFQYLPLVQDYDLIFRVPVTARKSKPVQLNTTHPHQIAMLPTALSMQPKSIQGGVNAKAQASHNQHPHHDLRLISTTSEDSTIPRHRPQRDVAIDSDDEVPPGMENVEANRRAANRVQQPRRHSRDIAAISRDRISSRVRQSAAHHLADNLRTKLIDLESYEIQIGLPLVTEDDGFPDTDFDIIHVQYLAAVCGAWNDAVGLRRMQQGFADEYIAGFLDNAFTPVHMAAFLGNYDILLELVQQGGLSAVAQDIRGDTPLHVACKRGHVKIVRYLCQEHGLSPTMLNQASISPLQYALKGGYLETVTYFMEECGSLVHCDYIDSEYGASLLHWAALSMRPKLMDYLISHQHVNVEVLATADGSTPFLWACYGSSKEGVQHLVEKASALVTATDQTGMTGLHYATLSGYVDKVIYLMDSVRLKVTDKDENHQTPYDVAKGAASFFLTARKEKGFVTGSIIERTKDKEK
jgi:serine/threonine protein kinase/ankyrin repeat protein